MTARYTPAPRSEALGAVQMSRAGDACSADAIAVREYTTMLPQSPYPCCESPRPGTQGVQT
jgi:hypothetical protein